MENMVNSKDFWQDRPVFVTGATGLLGSSLILELINKRAEVTCLIRDWIPNNDLIKNNLIASVNTVRGEIQNQKLIERVLNEYEIETVFHLAAQTIVTTANRNPVSTFDSNIKGTWVLLESCRRSSTISQVITASSDKAYGIQKILPYTEDAPLQGKYPYDVSKSCADLISQSYYHTYGLPVCITRCGNLYGEGDLNFNRIIPGTIRSIIRNKNPIIRSDGKSIRDYFYIEDARNAYLRLSEQMGENNDIFGEAFNFSNESPISVIDLVNLIIPLMKSTLKPIILNESKNEIPQQYLKALKAKNMLKWKPLYTLTEGLNKTIAWYTEFLSRND